MKTVIMIPTYNERGNIARLLDEILTLDVPGHVIHALVVDDDSPDGTGGVVAELASGEPRIQLLTRKTGRGRGSAGIAGFKFALGQGADCVIEMDADFSHHPRYIPSLIQAADRGADVVLGSRFVDGGADDDRGLHRRLVTKFAGIYVRTMLGVGVRDVSSGYRCFKRDALERVGLGSLISTGPSIVLEILFKCALLQMRIAEVPIVFIDRREGQTKLNTKTLIKTLLMVAKFRLLHIRGQLVA